MNNNDDSSLEHIYQGIRSTRISEATVTQPLQQFRTQELDAETQKVITNFINQITSKWEHLKTPEEKQKLQAALEEIINGKQVTKNRNIL